MELCLNLPWPPSVNHYKKVGRLVKTKTGKLYQQRVNTDETRTYYFQVYMRTKQIIPHEWAKFADSATIEYQIWVYLHPPNSKRYDLDNRLKILLDSLTRANIIKDDSQISRLYVEKRNIIDGGQVMVRIQEIV